MPKNFRCPFIILQAAEQTRKNHTRADVSSTLKLSQLTLILWST
jgi:hypothetical protein